MERVRDRILKNLSEINERKNQISEALSLFQDTYLAYKLKKKKRRTYFLSFTGFGLAASIILGFVLLPSLTRLDPERVFQHNYERFQFDLNERNTGNPDPLSFTANLYMMGFNEKALLKVDSSLTITPGEVKWLFIKGLVELDQGFLEDAEDILLQVADKGGALGSTAQWYVSLIYLRQGKYSEASKWLKIVKGDQDSPFSKKASKVFHRLRFRKIR